MQPILFFSRVKIREFVEHPLFSKIVTGLIIFNAIILGMETYPSLLDNYGSLLLGIDYIILWIFVIEICLRLTAYGFSFFRNPWSVFDLIIILISLMPVNQAFSVLRAVRVLRVLRLISMFPKLRRVIEGLVRAIPGIASIGAIMSILLYVFAVMGTKLYGKEFPEFFGSLQLSLFTLFQVMTLEGWPDIVREVMKIFPQAWIFFVTYILLATFSVLNLFIAVIVDAMQKQHEPIEQEEHDSLKRIEKILIEVHQKLESFQKKL